MKTLSELNEELYEKVGRLHTYEGFLSETQAKQVADYIFKEYKSAVDEYFEETKLKREKRLFELAALNRSLTPKRTFFGLFANKTAKEAEKQIKPIAEAYRAEYALDDVLFDAMREDEPAVEEDVEEDAGEDVEEDVEEDTEEDAEEKPDTAGTVGNGAKNGAENAVVDNDGDKSTPAEKEAETPVENDEEEDDEEIIEDDEEDVADPFLGQMEMEL